MLVRFLRILLGFALACFTAGVAMVLFVFTPAEILGLPPDVRADRLGKAIELAVLVAAQVALFAAPLVLVAVAIGEMLGWRGWSYYALTGLLIAGLGFFAQRATEQIGQPTIANNYALTAFLVSGFLAGLVYWIAGGRFAGHPRSENLRESDPNRTETSSDSHAPDTTTPSAQNPEPGKG